MPIGIVPDKPFKSKMKDETTKVRIGTDLWEPNPYFSNTDQWEERYGEPGDWLGGVVVGGADLVHNTIRLGTEFLGPNAGTAAGHAHNAFDNWVMDGQARVTAPIPKQEPVDWGL